MVKAWRSALFVFSVNQKPAQRLDMHYFAPREMAKSLIFHGSPGSHNILILL